MESVVEIPLNNFGERSRPGCCFRRLAKNSVFALAKPNEGMICRGEVER
jgi:hypothetical protein